MSRSSPLRRAGVVILAAQLVATLAACTGDDDPPPEQAAASRFLAAVGARQVERAARLTDDRSAAGAGLHASLTGLGEGARGRFDVTSSKTTGSRSRVSYAASWNLAAGTKPWQYRGAVTMTRRAGHWLVAWRPADVHPDLDTGTHLAAVRTQPARAALLDRNRKPLFARTAVVAVGIEPRRVTDLPRLAARLAGVSELDSSRSEIVAAVHAAEPTDFVPVISLRRPVYERIRPRIYSLPGTVFRTETQLLARTPSFGQPLLGRVQPATAEIVRHAHGRVATGDVTGVGGLQQAYDKTLAGRPGVRVVIVDEDTGETVKTLATVTDPQPGRPVHLTIDAAVQAAAEDALAGVDEPAALVAVQPSTGRILADADTSAVTYDYGLQGAFPPGSTFKIATWAAAFTDRSTLRPSTRVACPATTTVDGRVFENENKFSHPPVPISAAFGYSCNTSAIREALQLPASALADTARRLGLGGKWSLPVPAFSGSIPTPTTQTERGADGIGQGRVLASPLLMALMAGAAGTGRVIAPSLDAGDDVHALRTLPASLVAKMRILMTATVRLPGGTAHDLEPLGDVIGKTGTAEYGTATPPRSHAWFAGLRGDVAFAVFIHDGATKGGSAVPVARTFLRRLG